MTLPLNPALHTACPICEAEVGAPCTEDDGTPRSVTHHRRMNRLNQDLVRRDFLVRMRQDLPEAGLATGQVILARTHPEDPASYLVLLPAKTGPIPSSSAAFVEFSTTRRHLTRV